MDFGLLEEWIIKQVTAICIRKLRKNSGLYLHLKKNPICANIEGRRALCLTSTFFMCEEKPMQSCTEVQSV